jgi:hypothetical protein
MSSEYNLSNGFKIYGIIAIISFILFIIGYSSFPFWLKLTNSNSAISMVSSLIQSEAAVLGIVVTLSLVAVQLTASSYSTRVIRIFKNSYSLWILIIIYIITIIYSIFILKMMPNDPISYNNEFQIWLAYLLGIYSFTALIPYTIDILNLMEPKNITIILSKKITNHKIDAHGNNKESYYPIQPVMDILTLSLMKHDYGTLREGLDALKKSIMSLLDDMSIDDNQIIDDFLVSHIFDQLLTLVEISKRNNKDEYSILILSEILTEAGKKTAEKKLKKTTLRDILSLFILGKLSVDETLQKPVIKVVDALEEIGCVSGENKLNKSFHQSVHYVENIGIDVMKNRLHKASDHVIKSLETMGLKAAELGLKKITSKSIYSLEKVGMTAAINDREKDRRKVVESIGKIGLKEAKNQHVYTTIKTINSLKKIGVAASTKHIKTTRLSVYKIVKIGKIAAKQRMENTTLFTVNSLLSIANVLENNNYGMIIKIMFEIEELLQYENSDIYFSEETLSNLNQLFKSYNDKFDFKTEKIESLIDYK